MSDEISKERAGVEPNASNHAFSHHLELVSNAYSMSGRAVLNIQSQTEGEWLYIQYNTDANVVNNL